MHHSYILVPPARGLTWSTSNFKKIFFYKDSLIDSQEFVVVGYSKAPEQELAVQAKSMEPAWVER